jgi:hypothetical protein
MAWMPQTRTAEAREIKTKEIGVSKDAPFLNGIPA